MVGLNISGINHFFESVEEYCGIRKKSSLATAFNRIKPLFTLRDKD